MTDETLPFPRGICPVCQATRAGGRTHIVSGTAFLYCPHNLVGGVLERTTEGGRMWHLYTPVTREEFERQAALYAERYAELNGAPPVPLN